MGLPALGGDRELPLVGVYAGRGTGGEHGEVVCEVLARRQPVVDGSAAPREPRRNDVHGSVLTMPVFSIVVFDRLTSTLVELAGCKSAAFCRPRLIGLFA